MKLREQRQVAREGETPGVKEREKAMVCFDVFFFFLLFHFWFSVQGKKQRAAKGKCK